MHSQAAKPLKETNLLIKSPKSWTRVLDVLHLQTPQGSGAFMRLGACRNSLSHAPSSKASILIVWIEARALYQPAKQAHVAA